MSLETYHFVIITDRPEEEGDIALKLFRAGCVDATVSVQGGEVIIQFDRVAPTFESAHLSARRDVEKLGLVIRRSEVPPPPHLEEVADDR